MVFGHALRKAIKNDETRFDRIQLMEETINPIYDATIKVLKEFGGPK